MVDSFGENPEHFFYRKDMSPESLKKMVEDFVDQMEKSQKQMIKLLPQSIFEGWQKYSDLIKTEEYKNFSPERKITIRQKLGLLKNMLTLPIYSWVRLLFFCCKEKSIFIF